MSNMPKLFNKVQENQAKQKDERIERYAPIALEMSKIISESGISAKDFIKANETNKRSKEINEVIKKVLELFLERNIEVSQLKTIFQIALVPVDFVQNCVVNDFGRNEVEIIAKRCGVKEWHERTFGDLDRIARENEGAT